MITRDTMFSPEGVCPMCNHNRVFHVYVQETRMMLCKVRNCKCLRSVAIGMMDFSTELLEELK